MSKQTKNQYSILAKHSIINKAIPQLEILNPLGEYSFGDLKTSEEALMIEGRTLTNIVRHIRSYMAKNGGLFLAFEEKDANDTVLSVLVYRIDKAHKYANLAVTEAGGKNGKTLRYRALPDTTSPTIAPVQSQIVEETIPVKTKKPLMKKLAAKKKSLAAKSRSINAPIVVVDKVHDKVISFKGKRDYANPINGEEVLKLYEGGQSVKRIAADYKISTGYVYSLTSRARMVRKKNIV